MCHSGYRFEAAAIARLILEQLAWAYAVHGLDDLSLFEVNPTKTFTKLKEIIPYAGQLYGTLSDEAHISPETSAAYLRFEGEKSQVIVSSIVETKLVAFQLLLLVDAYSVVANVTHRSFFETATELTPLEVVKRQASRPMLDTLREWRKRLEEELSQDG